MNILSLREDELIKILLKRDFKAFRVKQIFEWIYQKKVSSFDEMTSLSLDIRAFLNKNFKLYSLKLKDKQVSQAEETKKYLFELEDGYLIESVLILSEKRRTICVSTQVGCSIRCTFCASGKKGFFRDLKAFEIIEQIIHITKDTNQPPTHIVFMGMGEPLANLTEVMKSIKILHHPNGQNIGHRKITISTSGLTVKIKELADIGIPVKLAVSLISADEKIRAELMPVAGKETLKALKASLVYFQEKTKKRITRDIEGFNIPEYKSNRNRGARKN